jgi:ferritin-like metal-binding protein YciE
MDRSETVEIASLQDLFVHEIRGVYHMEQQLVDALDEMADRATDEELSEAFADHRNETDVHVARIQQVFQEMDVPVEARENPIVEALDRERRTVEGAVQDDDLLNLFYLGAGMKAERIELTTYDNLLRIADRLDLHDEVTDPLEQNRDSEERAMRTLEKQSKRSGLKSLWERFSPTA